MLRARYPQSLYFDDQGAVTRNGRAQFLDLPAGTYTVEFWSGAERLGELEATLQCGETEALEFEVPASDSIPGVVLLGADPASGGNVDVSGPPGSFEVRVDSTGAFILPLREAGEYVLTYQRQGAHFPSKTFTIQRGSELVLQYDVVSFSGRILLPSGNPWTHGKGSLVKGPDPASMPFRTGEDGRFSIPYVVPGEYTWRLEAAPEAFLPHTTVFISNDTCFAIPINFPD